MRGIIFRIPMDVIIQTIMAILSSEGDFLPQIMLIAALTMYNLSENSRLRHMINHHFVSAVDAVLHKHNGRLGFLIAVHESPALGNGISTAHFGSYRLSGTHSGNRDFTVGIP